MSEAQRLINILQVMDVSTIGWMAVGLLCILFLVFLTFFFLGRGEKEGREGKVRLDVLDDREHLAGKTAVPVLRAEEGSRNKPENNKRPSFLTCSDNRDVISSHLSALAGLESSGRKSSEDLQVAQKQEHYVDPALEQGVLEKNRTDDVRKVSAHKCDSSLEPEKKQKARKLHGALPDFDDNGAGFATLHTPHETEGCVSPVTRVAIFIDYSNFDKNWNDNAFRFLRVDRNRISLNWEELTNVIMEALPQAMGHGAKDLLYRYTKVQASVFPERFKTPRGFKLPKEISKDYYLYVKDSEDIRHKFDGREYIARQQDPQMLLLRDKLGLLPGYDVHISERIISRDEAGNPKIASNRKGKPFIRSFEKAVDARVISDLTLGAAQDAFDVAVLLASDTDYLPVIQNLQEHFCKTVIHIGFEKGGHQVRAASWGHILLNQELIERLAIISHPAAEEATAMVAAVEELKKETRLKPVRQVVELFQAVPLPEQEATGPKAPVCEMPLSAEIDKKDKKASEPEELVQTVGTNENGSKISYTH